MKIIGVTGGVGAGKSAVLTYLQERYGAHVVLADQVANLLEEPGQSCYEPIVELLGKSVLQEDGCINRSVMGQMIFSDSALLKKVNNIIHPAVKQYILKQIEKHRCNKTEIFVIEAALLLEDNYDAICDEVWYIYTSEAVRRERLKESRGYSDDYITDIIRKQLSEEVFRTRCDVIIDNSGTVEDTQKQIDIRMS